MASVLIVATLKLSNPVIFSVLVKADDATFHNNQCPDLSKVSIGLTFKVRGRGASCSTVMLNRMAALHYFA